MMLVQGLIYMLRESLWSFIKRMLTNLIQAVYDNLSSLKI